MKQRPMMLMFIGCLIGITVAKERISFVAVIFLILFVLAACLYKRWWIGILMCMAVLLSNLFYTGEVKRVTDTIDAYHKDESSYEDAYVYRRVDKTKSVALYIRTRWGKMLIYYGGKEEVVPGDTIRIMGKAPLVEDASNPGEFSSRDYHFSQGIYYQQFLNQVQILNHNKRSLSYGQYRVQQFIKKRITIQYNENQAAFLQGMFLGDKSLLDNSVKDAFKESGMVHLLAVSGLHISLFGGSLYKLLRKIGLGFLSSGMLGLSIAFLYGGLTGSSLSTVRAVFMLGIYLLAQVLGEAYDLLSCVSFAGTCLLLYHPFFILSGGFLLSFGAVFIIGIYQQRKRLNKPILEALSFAVFLCAGMFPIIIWVQYEAPVGSFLANVLGVPLASYVFLGAFLFIPLPVGLWHGMLGKMMDVIFWLSKQDYGLLTIGKVSILWVVLWYVAMAVLLRKKHSIGKIPRIACFYICVLVLMIMTWVPNQQLTFLDVGQGDAIAIGGKNGMIFIDGGSTSKKDVHRYQLLPYLKYMGCDKIDMAIITHTDSDHYSGLLELMKLGKVSYLGMPDIAKDEAYLKIEKVAKESGTQLFYLSEGRNIIGKDINLQVLHPSKDSSLEKNAASIVLNGRIYGKSILLTGDIEKEGEEELISESLNQVDILKVAHHGSKYSTYEELLQKVKPQIGVISCGLDNLYGHPHSETLSRLKDYHTNVYRTDLQGAIIFKDNQVVTWKNKKGILK